MNDCERFAVILPFCFCRSLINSLRVALPNSALHGRMLLGELLLFGSSRFHNVFILGIVSPIHAAHRGYLPMVWARVVADNKSRQLPGLK